jgi:pseudouridine synthase
MEARLQKVLSQWGVASRRQAEEMIRHSRVRINGALAELGQKVDPQRDVITVDGKAITTIERPSLIYLLLNKPVGVVSTCDDPQGRTTVLDLLPKELNSGLGIHPVGRLDAESTGALILTNDGDLTYALTHPKHSIPKTYSVLVQGRVNNVVLEKWRQGVILDGRKTRQAIVRIVKKMPTQTRLEIVLKEGRNRQIRRVAQQLGHPVIELHRTAIGSIELQKTGQSPLSEGSYRYLEDFEIISLHSYIDSY